MAKKPHCLLLLFEGLPATVIQSQVLERVRWLENEGIATFDLLSFAHSKALFDASASRLNAIPFEMSKKITLVKGIRPAIPGSRVINRRLLALQIAKTATRYDLIQARGDYAAAVAGPWARSKRLPMIWDCRGDGEAEFYERCERQGRRGPQVTWRAREARKDGLIAARTASIASFVSHPLRAKWRGEMMGKPSCVIPCVADQKRFYFDPVLRSGMRAKLDYAPSDVVFVYSGSLNFYQGFDLMIDWFRTASTALPSARLLILTPQVAEARSMLRGMDQAQVTVISAAFENVNGYLNAADYGFLLRPVSKTNKAAFPTKFAEYGLTGLATIIGPSVPDCFEFAKSAGNLVPADAPAASLHGRTEARAATMSHFVERLTHQGLSNEICTLYRNIPKSD